MGPWVGSCKFYGLRWAKVGRELRTAKLRMSSRDAQLGCNLRLVAIHMVRGGRRDVRQRYGEDRRADVDDVPTRSVQWRHSRCGSWEHHLPQRVWKIEHWPEHLRPARFERELQPAVSDGT